MNPRAWPGILRSRTVQSHRAQQITARAVAEDAGLKVEAEESRKTLARTAAAYFVCPEDVRGRDHPRRYIPPAIVDN